MTTQKVSVTLEKTAVERGRRTAGPRGSVVLHRRGVGGETRTLRAPYCVPRLPRRARGRGPDTGGDQAPRRGSEPIRFGRQQPVERPRRRARRRRRHPPLADPNRKFRSTLRHLVAGGWEPVIPTVVLAEAVTGRDQDAPVNQVVRQLGTHDTAEATALPEPVTCFSPPSALVVLPNPEWYRRHRRSPRGRCRSRCRLHH